MNDLFLESFVKEAMKPVSPEYARNALNRFLEAARVLKRSSSRAQRKPARMALREYKAARRVYGREHGFGAKMHPSEVSSALGVPGRKGIKALVKYLRKYPEASVRF